MLHCDTIVLGDSQCEAAFEGKVAIITGATSGIGEQAAALFAAEGAKVVIGGRRVAEGNAVVERLGENESFIKTDVLDETQESRQWSPTRSHALVTLTAYSTTPAGVDRRPTALPNSDMQ